MSDPYPALPRADKDFTLDAALTATQENGKIHCGKLEFSSQAEFADFATAQRKLGGTPDQLATLQYVERTGETPDMGKMAKAPEGTTVHALLDTAGKKPDAQGFYHLGTLKVHESEMKDFAKLQHDIVQRNPEEGLAALYHMEHAPDKDVTFRVTKDNDRVDRYDPNTNTIYWNPHTLIRDAYDKHLVPPDTAALHEETHWAGRAVGATLQRIPAGHMENREEQRVIAGTERRDMELAKLAPRDSHYGWVMPTDKIHSIVPSLTATQDGRTREMHAPYEQSGKVIAVNADGTTTLALRGDGKHPGHQITFKTEQLSTVMGGLPNAENALANAQEHADTVTFKLSADGKFTYSDPAQAHRQTTQQGHDPSFTYPTNMTAVTQGNVPDQRQAMEVGR